jgi:hypothetical protein
LVSELKDDGIILALTRVKAPVRDMFEKTGVVETVGSDQIYGTNPAAVAGHVSRTGAAPDPDEVTMETANALAELARLVDDDEVTRRLQRTIEALESDASPES